MNIEETCRCKAVITIDDPTASIISTTTRDALADFRAGHACPYRGEASEIAVEAEPMPSASKPLPF